MAVGLADLFTNGFAFLVDRLIAEGGGLTELRDRFRQLYPGSTLPHANTLNALIGRVRQSIDVSTRLDRGVKPRSASYPQVPKGFDCDGFLYRVIVPVKRPVFGTNRVETVDMPVEIQSPSPLNIGELDRLVPGAIESMQQTRDNYQLVRFGVVRGGWATGDIRVSAAYRC